jgi:uncharacterized repeat protein (TIGR03806 family)
MIVSRLIVLGVMVCLGIVPIFSVAQTLERVANTTISLPDKLPATAFKLELAFPEIRSFSQPVAIVSPPGETNRLFVLERTGRIRVIPDLENPERVTFLSITREVQSGSGEQGILGLAFHPDYQRNGTFFIFYTARETGSPNRLSRFQVDPENPNEALVESEVILFSQRDDAGNHNGGDLHFGPDGYLYVSLGDEGAANDSLNNSQRLDRDFFAGILRIDIDKRPGNLEPNPHPAIVFDESGQANYSVPVDNPYVGVQQFNGTSLIPQEVRTEFWAVGLRNPWRMDFDSATGDLYVGDVGQGRLEEIDIIVKGGNYGWNYREGSIDGPNRREAPAGVNFIDPILEYSRGSRSNQGNSVTGGIVYRGSRIASLFGSYLFADYASGNLWRLRYDGTSAVEWENIGRETGISAFGEDPSNGDVLLADFNSNRIRRLVQDESPDLPEVLLPESLAETGVFLDLASLTPNTGVVPYSINTPFWSDGAIKRRWFSVPDLEQKLVFAPSGNWEIPSGAVWIKHFNLELEQGNPESTRRLETRLIVKNDEGVYGVTYRWDEAQENAFLVPEEGQDELFVVEKDGTLFEQVWRYPSRGECLNCHTKEGGEALGFNTAQLNRSHRFGDGDGDENQILAYSRAGYFTEPVDSDSLGERSVALDNDAESLSERVGSYLASNCSQCHQPGGASIGLWDARLESGLGESGIIGGVLANPSIHPGRRVVVPGDPGASELLRRISSLGTDRMPPLGSNVLDEEAIDLVREWITQSFPKESFDDWAGRYFGSPLDPRAAASNDHDGDGQTNSLEFRLRTDPIDHRDWWRLAVSRTEGGLEIRFPFIVDRSLKVDLEESSALGDEANWRVVDLSPVSPFYGDQGQTVHIGRPLPDQGNLFFRVVFSDQQ